MKFPFSRLFRAGRRTRTTGPGPATPAARKGRFVRLRLEHLEDRLAPAVVTWTGAADIASGGANNRWTTAANWANNIVPTTGDTVVFGTYTPPTQAQIQSGAADTGTTFNDFTAVPQLAAIYFTTPNWRLQGNPVALSGDANGLGIVSANAPSNSATGQPDVDIELVVSMNASQTFQVRNPAALMVVSLLVRVNGHTLTLDPEGGSVLEVTGQLDDQLSVSTGQSHVVKTGTGQATLAGNNFYGGPTDIFNGILWARSNNALGPPVFGSVNGVPGLTTNGAFVHPGGSLGIGASLATGGLDITKDVFLAGDGFQGLGALINAGANPSLGAANITNSLFGTITLQSPSGETLVNMIGGGTLDHTGGWKQPRTGSQSPVPLVQSLTKIGSGTLIMDGRGVDPFWGSATTPFESLFFTNTYTGQTLVADGTLILQKVIRENTPTQLLIGSNISGLAADGSYTGGDNPPTDPLLGAGHPPGGYSIQGNLVVGDGVGGRDSAQVITLTTGPSRDDPTTVQTPGQVEEIEAEQIADHSTVTVNSDGLLSINSYADPFRIQVSRSRPVGERIASLNVIGGDVRLNVNPNTSGFPAPVEGGNPAVPPTQIVGTLLAFNLVMQGGTITGGTSTDSGDTVPNETLQGTLMLIGGGITILASPETAVINCLLDLGFTTRSVVVIHGSAFPDLDIQGPVGNGGLVIGAASNGGVVRMSNNNQALTPDNVTFPHLGFTVPPPYPSLVDFANSGISITLVSGDLLLASDTSVGSGRLVIFGGTIQSDNSARTISNPVTIAGDFSVIGNLNVTFTGQIALNGTHTITVGNLVTTFSGTVVNVQGSSGGLYKAGPGILVYAGNNPNTYAGVTWVRDGELLLEKPNGVVSVAGPLYIGDGAGPPGSAAVGVITNDQISAQSGVSLQSDGILAIAGGFHDTIASLFDGGQVVLGASGRAPSTLTVNGSVILGGGSILASGLGGTLVLNTPSVSALAGAGPSVITVDVEETDNTIYTYSVDAGTQLTVGGAISGGTALYKTGGGTLAFTGSTANTYGGITWVQTGGLLLQKDPNVTAVPGNLFIGGLGGSNMAIVGVAANEQLPNSSIVTVYADAIFEIAAGVTEIINTLNLAGGLILDPGSHLFVHILTLGPTAVIVDNSPGGLVGY
jgi:autotransporter-associated beta strand protein